MKSLWATTIRRLGTVVIAAGTVAALGGCGSDDGGTTATSADAAASSAAASPASSAVSSASSSPAKNIEVTRLLLPADQFPSGFTAQEVPAGQADDTADSLLDATKGAKVSPSSCVQLNALPDKIDLSNVGMMMASRGMELLTTSVAPAADTVDLKAQRASIAGKCKNMTISFTQGEMKGATVELKQKVVTAPKTKADQALVIDQNIVADVGGQQVDSLTRLGLAQVNGYTVSVQYRSMSPGAPVDQKVFNDLFVKAVNRVAAQTR
ncbi:hypothetical protein GOHSU_23_00470 [Gordonia hirsuta DSM 44140 = NBRC 16056]|uniref:DUF5642 domain-containing protein n=1 Tax=Gordonia hirsuta DSM 44140 = NBRC 16056 TaxID=1121927 RepID=L7LAB3_9ACTN|nr:hypothetical protein [Gordonia hirsuta]GAC57701.1 hypothetical protein GOHSU_23_00470 [Gordonia hirsuta DSM 44140 = NBRC 16056]